MDPGPRQFLNSESQERRHRRELADRISELSRHPETITSIFRTILESSAECHSRYAIAKALRYVIPLGRHEKSAFHAVCTTGLPDVLLGAALDPLIYMWHDESSSFYDPKLGEYVRDIFASLHSIYNYILESDNDEINGCYKDLATQVPRATARLWRLVWLNRRLLLPENNVPPLGDENSIFDGYRAAVVLFMESAYRCHQRVASETYPSWSPSAAQVLLYSWPHLEERLIRQITCELFCLIFFAIEDEISDHIIPAAVPNMQMAIHLTKQLCQDIESAAVFGIQMKHYPVFLRYLVQYSPYVVGAVASGDANIFWTAAVALERQPCSVGVLPVQMDTYESFIEATAILLRELLSRSDVERMAYLSDLYSFNIITCIASQALPPAIKQGNKLFADNILSFFKFYSSFAAQYHTNPLRSKDKGAIQFRTRLRQHWFQMIHAIEELHLEHGHFGHEILRRWKDLRPQLNIRSIDRSSDLNHSAP